MTLAHIDKRQVDKRPVDKRPVPKVVRLPLAEDQLKAIFKKHDKNRDGRLCRKEVRGAFEELGAYFPDWRAWCGICNADANGDGFITEDELNGLVKYAMQLGYTVN